MLLVTPRPVRRDTRGPLQTVPLSTSTKRRANDKCFGESGKQRERGRGDGKEREKEGRRCKGKGEADWVMKNKAGEWREVRRWGVWEAKYGWEKEGKRQRGKWWGEGMGDVARKIGERMREKK